MRFKRTEHILSSALQARAFTAVSAEAGRLHGPEWSFAAGRLAGDPGAAVVSGATIFDLASLTKVLATASIGLKLISARQLDLSTPVGNVLSSWRTADRASVKIRDFFEHSSGLPAHRRFFETLTGRAAYENAIARELLEYAPRSRSIYSDLGFIMLGFILEDLGGAPLDNQFREWRKAAGMQQPLDFATRPDWRSLAASTGFDPWRGRVLKGEVHDENAAALNGVAAHAGLFGTAGAVGENARWWLARLAGDDDLNSGVSAATAQIFAKQSTVPGSSRALGWDTMLPTSSCGSHFSPRAIGHTGFTGTSLWIDPEMDFYAVLLTNFVHDGRDREKLRVIRREFHDAVIRDRFH